MRKLRSILALLLVLAMALSLAACGGDKTEDPKETERPSMVYKADFLQVKSDELTDGITPVVYTDEGFYGLSYGKIGEMPPPEENAEDGEETGEEEPAVSTGELDVPEPAYADQYAIYGYKIFFVGFDGSVRSLPKYESLPALENTEDKLEFYSGSNLQTLLDDGEGGLIAVESQYTGWFDGTEAELRSGGDEIWEKYRSSNIYYLRYLNADGSEKDRVQIDFDAQDMWLNFNSCVLDEEGNLLVFGDQVIYAFAPDGSLKYQINSDVWMDRLIPMQDGRMAGLGYSERGMALYPINGEKKRLDEPIQLPDDVGNLLPGDGNYDFYYVNGMYLYGYKLESQEKTRVLNFIDVDVNGYNMAGLHVFPDGHMVGTVNQWKNDTVKTEIVTLSLVPSNTLPQKQTLTLAVLYVDDIYDKVVEFNRHSDTVRIEILDYSEYNDYENENYDAGRTKLLTEIMSGQMPDIISLGQLPYSQLAAKGLLEDLYPMIDKDPELKREDFFPNVLKALEVNGGLYQITPSFNVQTLVGSAAVVGDKPGWNYAQLQEALSTMPEGCDPMDMYITRKDILTTLLAADLDHYVDWTNGTCNFESEDFIQMLEFTAQFPDSIPENIEWESSETRIAQGRQMLTTAYLYNVEAMMWNDVMFGEQGCTYIGYPTNNGVGSYMSLESGFAISSTCKDKEAAWEFLRSYLLPEAQENVSGIPVRLDAYQKQLDRAMEIEYQKDDKGNYVLDDNGQRIQVPRGGYATEDGKEYKIYAMTQEQADKLWEAVITCDKLMTYDTEIFDIVTAQAEAYYAGDKSAEEVARLVQSKMNLYINERR